MGKFAKHFKHSMPRNAGVICVSIDFLALSSSFAIIAARIQTPNELSSRDCLAFWISFGSIAIWSFHFGHCAFKEKVFLLFFNTNCIIEVDHRKNCSLLLIEIVHV